MSDTDTETTEEYDARMARADEEMRAAGVNLDESIQIDYFGFDETERIMLPDHVSYVDIKALNEGGRRQYLNTVNREARIAKGSGDTVIRLANGDERKILIKLAICGWNLMRRSNRAGNPLEPVPFKDANIIDFLDKVSPTVLDVVDKAVRKQNPWLMQDVELDDLLKQREELDEMIEKKRAEEEGKES